MQYESNSILSRPMAEPFLNLLVLLPLVFSNQLWGREFDVIIHGGTVIDGSGSPGFQADVALKGQRIAAISQQPLKSKGAQRIDATGLIVSPGFIDMHAHIEPITKLAEARSMVSQGITTAVGGVLPEEFQAKNNFDRTETLGSVFLGVSLVCARCHTHKYDPIPQTEYYRLLAFFNSTAESPLDGNSYTYAPVIKAPANQAVWDRWNALETVRDELLSKAQNTAPETAIPAYAKARNAWTVDDWRLSKVVEPTALAPDATAWQEVKDLPGVSKTKLPKADQAIWLSFSVNAPVNQILWLTFSTGPGAEALLDGAPIGATSSMNQNVARILLSLSKGSRQVRLKLVGTKQVTAIEVRLKNPWQAIAKAESWQACAKQDRLLTLADPEGPFAHLLLQSQARTIAHRTATLTADFTTTLVARDLSKPRPTRLLKRGEYNLPTGDPLQPGILTVMGAFPTDAPRNRLGLARWLTARGHPLVARVLINRIWQSVFGEGFVRTPEDFGLQGQQPTHPKLLDWLAVELQDRDWNMKDMLRLLVTSQTFRQSSAWRDMVNDPENRLWARGPSYRLDAEVLRDLALWASGLLDPHMGGEGVKPYQPDGMWIAMAHPGSNTKRYVKDQGQKLYRRSLYVYWKRTSPHPMMTLFDAPSRETSCVKRSRTNTSLQSLALLNETQRLEVSRTLAARLLRESDTKEERLNRLFGLLACRNPNQTERIICAKLLQSMRSRFENVEEDARALLAAGDAPLDQTLNPAEHAAWAQLTITMLASDVALLLY